MCTKQQFDSVVEDVVAGVIDIMEESLNSIFLYGSYARGDYNEESDIDIMVLANLDASELSRYRSRLSVLASRTGLENDVMVVISLMDADTVFGKQDAVPFYQNILREGVNLLAG
ncbi:nucleotidyltransferase domain-containing protein [Christensenellaceae bacterium OttesenSCG-928-K19]|nr:nucleotidyltransferase domain-containing protein [Christensenellaceae bacterium OttesenSCG-928-K19]